MDYEKLSKEELIEALKESQDLNKKTFRFNGNTK